MQLPRLTCICYTSSCSKVPLKWVPTELSNSFLNEVSLYVDNANITHQAGIGGLYSFIKRLGGRIPQAVYKHKAIINMKYHSRPHNACKRNLLCIIMKIIRYRNEMAHVTWHCSYLSWYPTFLVNSLLFTHKLSTEQKLETNWCCFVKITLCNICLLRIVV